MIENKILKNKNTNIYNKMTTNNIMDINDFFNKLEEKHNKCFYRHINIRLNKKGHKIPTGEKNNLSIEEIKNNRGNKNYNTLSLSVKHVPHLYVVDFDTKKMQNCELYDMLNNDNVAHTETNKGFHYYIIINNIDKYSNQQKIYIKEDIEIDLIKTNNIWETKGRIVKGEIKEYDWNNIKKYFNIKKMNFIDSPPTTPPQSPKTNKSSATSFINEKNYDINELKSIIDLCKDKDECYEYFTWLSIGMALHNITNGHDIGLGLFKDFTSEYEGFKNKTTKRDVNTKWKSFDIEREGNKYGLTFLRKLKIKYEPEINLTLEQVFRKYVDDDRPLETINIAKNKVLLYLNTKLIFIKETGDFIILDKKQVKREDGTNELRDCWFLKTTYKVKDHFSKENFTYTYEIKNAEGKKETKEIFMNPIKEWLEWINRREVSAIGFDPRENPTKDIFNLWNGFAISHEEADKYDEKDAQPILDHIKELWAQDNEEVYNYVLNLFAHYIQKPHVKTGVLLALKSKQGGGKGIILDKLAKIIGEDHYVQNSNADYLFGNFNGQLEGKIVCNLDEAFWGGDKKKEGVVKNKITETRQTINKKNKEAYKVDDYVNYIITTNNDWFTGVSEDDRRNYCIELSNKIAGRMTKKTTELVQPVLDAPCEAFAKVLYNRDISDFKPRIFTKTKLLQDQVERGWNSVKTWYNSVLKDGGFTISHEGEKRFVEWNKLYKYGNTFIGGAYVKNKKTKNKQTAYCKDWIFDCYNQASADNRKFSKEAFYRELKKNCIRETDDLLIDKKLQIKKERKPFLFLPSIEMAREEWYNHQQYDYEYGNDDDDEWGLDSDYDSDDE